MPVQRIDGKRDHQPEDDKEWGAHEGIGQREGHRPVEGKVEEHIPEFSPGLACGPGLAHFADCEVAPVEVDVEADEPAERFGLADRRRCSLIDRGLLRAAEGAAVFNLDDDRFMGRIDRLDHHRHDGECDEQEHRQPGGQEEPEERLVFHGLRSVSVVARRAGPALQSADRGGDYRASCHSLTGSPFPWPLRYRPLPRPSAPARRFPCPA